MDAALGALLGAAVGDSCGSYLEFQRSIPPARVETALTMPGGGPWSLLPGQVTDDTELAFALAHALLEKGERLVEGMKFAGLPASCVARWYGKWMGSPPFDCGMTCGASMQCSEDMTEADDATDAPATACMTAARLGSMGSKANGGLMRLTPLPIFYHRCTDAQVAALAAADAQLSHPNPTCQLTNALYAIMIARFIRNPHPTPGPVPSLTSLLPSLPYPDKAKTEVLGWIETAEAAARGEAVLDNCENQAGFVKHGFTYALYHLLKGSTFEEAIRHTLQGGGDTDTNAAIVGGLVGAALGANAIPAHMREVVVKCQANSGMHPRPEWLWPSQIPTLVEQLYNKLQPSATL